tara:strand:+ start:982 stop:1560 length:579 start_codon:yes stop_codon:yes gene_type:complete
MFNPDFIKIYDNVLSSYQCKEIIKWTENQDLKKGRLVNKDIIKVDLKYKSSWDVPYEKTIFSNKTFIDLMICDALGKCTSNYRESYPGIDNLNPWDVSDHYNIQKYNPGDGFFSLHCENGGGKTISRVLAWMIYLNTVTDKGGTYFSCYNKTLKAKEGRLVIWPAYFTHHHKGVVSKTQTKYIATGWYEFVD